MAEKKEGESGSIAVAKPKEKTKPTTRPVPKMLPPYNVVLIDDDDHTYDYVVEMLGVVFIYPVEKALGMAKEVDKTGRVIVLTSHKEHAELKRDQILGYGADPRLERSKGAMRAIVEPAEG